MVTRYDVVSSRWSSHFWVKMYDFQLLCGIKVKFVDKMMQSNYLCVTLRVERKKILFSLFSQDWHSHKMAAKMATIFGDVTDLQQRHHP